MTGETRMRAIIFKEGDLYVAQCLEHDIAAQSDDLHQLLDRLDMTILAEMELHGESGLSGICKAPLYYHQLWEKPGGVALKRVDVVVDGQPQFDLKLAA